MKTTNISLVLGMFLIGALLFSSCSKDKNDDLKPDPTDPELTMGTASATILFTDTEEKLQFDGTSWGALGSGAKGDTVLLLLNGKNTPAGFFLMLTPAKKGKLVMGKDGFASVGWFHKDSTQANIINSYLLGAENFPEDGSIKDAATFDITSISKDRIKGTFTATMVSNSTILQNGEPISGEIKTIKVTDGKFDVPLFNSTDIALD